MSLLLWGPDAARIAKTHTLARILPESAKRLLLFCYQVVCDKNCCRDTYAPVGFWVLINKSRIWDDDKTVADLTTDTTVDNLNVSVIPRR